MNNIRTITMTDDQIDNIVIDELKQSLTMQFNLDKDEGGEYLEPDFALIDSIKNVLAYYMSHGEYNRYVQEIAEQEETMHTQLGF